MGVFYSTIGRFVWSMLQSKPESQLLDCYFQQIWSHKIPRCTQNTSSMNGRCYRTLLYGENIRYHPKCQGLHVADCQQHMPPTRMESSKMALVYHVTNFTSGSTKSMPVHWVTINNVLIKCLTKMSGFGYCSNSRMLSIKPQFAQL